MDRRTGGLQREHLGLIGSDLLLVGSPHRSGQLVPQGSTGIEMGSGNENVGGTLLPEEAYSFMWFDLSLNGNSNGVGNALYLHGLELADGKPSCWTCQPDAQQMAGLNHNGIGRDGAQRASQVPEKQPAEIRGDSSDQQQLWQRCCARREANRKSPGAL